MIGFKDFCEKQELLEAIDKEISENEYLSEENMGDLDIANVIMSGLDTIKSQDIKAVVGAIAIIGKLMGKKVRDIIKLFSKSGFQRIKEFIDSDLLGSEEIQYLIRMKNDPNRYKGYSGLEQYIRDMKEGNPKLYDSITKAVTRIFT